VLQELLTRFVAENHPTAYLIWRLSHCRIQLQRSVVLPPTMMVAPLLRPSALFMCLVTWEALAMASPVATLLQHKVALQATLMQLWHLSRAVLSSCGGMTWACCVLVLLTACMTLVVLHPVALTYSCVLLLLVLRVGRCLSWCSYVQLQILLGHWSTILVLEILYFRSSLELQRTAAWPVSGTLVCSSVHAM
jgi:hypothetical protein